MHCQGKRNKKCPYYTPWGFYVKTYGGSGIPVEQGHCNCYYNQSNIWLDKNKTPCCNCSKKQPTDLGYKILGFLTIFGIISFVLLQVYLGLRGL